MWHLLGELKRAAAKQGGRTRQPCKHNASAQQCAQHAVPQSASISCPARQPNAANAYAHRYMQCYHLQMFRGSWLCGALYHNVK